MAEVVVASTEFQNRAGAYIEQAARTPVFITKHNRPVRVLLDIETYRKLRKNYREVLSVEELSEEHFQAILDAEPSPEAVAFNHEMDD